MTRLHLTALIFFTLMLCVAAPLSAYAQARPYTEIVLVGNEGDKDAIATVKKLMQKQLEELQAMDGNAAEVSARFMSLGPDLPKTSIIAKIDHYGVCGSSGCQIVVLQPTGKGSSYRKVYDSTAMRMFINLRKDKKYYDLLALVGPRQVDGFGVNFWNEKSNMYEFSGISRFSKK